MTAVEVLAATALASLMIVSVVGVLGGLVRQQRVLMQPEREPAWHRQLVAQLEWDLTNSRTMTVSPRDVSLEGFAGRCFATGVPTGRPTVVEYYVDNQVSPSALLRRETHSDESTNDNWRIELVCVGVDRLLVGEANVVGGVEESVSRRAETVPIPDQVAVRLHESTRPAPVFVHQFTLR